MQLTQRANVMNAGAKDNPIALTLVGDIANMVERTV